MMTFVNDSDDDDEYYTKRNKSEQIQKINLNRKEIG